MTRTKTAGRNKGRGAETAREAEGAADLLEIADGVTELVDRVVVVTDGWRVEEVGLIAQLREERWAGTQGAGDGRGGGYGSRVSGAAMLSLLETIDRGARDLVLDLGGETRRGTVEDRLRQVVGLASVAGSREVRHARRSVTYWVSAARMLLSWDARHVNLRVPCPYCRHYSLKVRVDLSTPVRCVECGVEWERNAWGVLMNAAENSSPDDTQDVA